MNTFIKSLHTAFNYIRKSTLATSVGLLVIVGGVGGALAITHAATTYDVMNVPDMTLAVRTTTTGTTGQQKIVVNWPRRNGVQVAYPTLSGGVLEVTQNASVEHIYYSRAINNATAKTFTLTGTIIRNLDWNNCLEYVSDGAGQVFTPGAKVRLTPDCRLLNRSLHNDRSNTMTASGAVAFAGSGSFATPTFATTAERDQQLGANPPGDSRAACVVATGLCYDYLGGAWIARTGGGGDPNATETVAGKVQLGTVKDQSGSTVTGTTGAATVLQTRYLTGIGGTASFYGRVPFLSKNGTLTGSVLGLGTRDSTTFLRGDGVYAAPVTSTRTEYGTGVDGSATITTANANLTANKEYTDLTVNTGAVLTTSGYTIKVSGTLTLYGTIAWNGNSGSNGGNASGNTQGAGGAGGPALASRTLSGGLAGVSGGAGGGSGTDQPGTAGTAGTAETMGLGTTGTAGAAGGTGGGAGAAGGAAGAAGSFTSPQLQYLYSLLANSPLINSNQARSLRGNAGSGGGGGGGQGKFNAGSNNTGAGGGGGSGSNGGNIDIAAKTIRGTTSGVIRAKGGTGGNGGNGQNAGASDGGGGGGASGSGGGGGTVVLVFSNKSAFAGSIDVSGGAPGTPGSGGTGSAGSGNAGATGSTGRTGISLLISKPE